MTIFEFNEQLCEIIAGEDGYYNYDKQEILDLARQMKTSAEEYENLQECKDAADAHETFYPNLCDVWLSTSPNNSIIHRQYAEHVPNGMMTR